MDLNELAKMTDAEAVAFLTNDANVDPERRAPRVRLTTIANTWNCIARDLMTYAHERSEEYAVIGAANLIFSKTADLAWNADVTINISAHPTVITMATARGATTADA